jgi:hypothetical protein
MTITLKSNGSNAAARATLHMPMAMWMCRDTPNVGERSET